MRVTPMLPALLLAALAGCGDRSPTTVDPVTPAPAPEADVTHPGERAFRVLSRQFPEFAGFYVDEGGDLVVRATVLGRDAALRGAVEPVAAALRASHGPANVRGVRMMPADYTFAELASWREGVRDPLFALEGVGMLDVDERRNRLVVGVTGESGRAAAEAVLARAGIPLEGVVFESMDQSEPFDPVLSVDGTFGCTGLRGTCRPVIGGYQIVFLTGSSGATCSVGFPALQGGLPRFVTASHCSSREWDLDHTAYNQPTWNSAVGSEVKDPRGWSCGFLSPYKCRYSDANLSAASAPVEVGYIARPAALGSLSIHPTSPRFTISSQRDAYVGERVYRVGRTTGMSTGTVDKTCTDFKKTWEGVFHAVMCSDVADYNTSGGDSGGPVFVWNGTSDLVTLVGVHYARNPLYDHAFFTPLSGVVQDLGALEARAPEYRTTSGGGGGGGGGIGGGCTQPEDPTVRVPTLIVEPC